MNEQERPTVYEFDRFRLDPSQRLLIRDDGTSVPLSGKAFDTLVYLVQRSGQLVSREELSRALWPRTIVDDANLNVAISTLRRALKDELPDRKFVATVTGRGYQFVAAVRVAPAGEPSDSVHAANGKPEREANAGSTAATRRRRAGALAITFVLALTGVAAVMATRAVRESPAPSRQVATLAVLPFKSILATGRNESLELGMTETLISGLNGSSLTVSPLSAVRRYANPEQDAIQAGRALGVEAVLEGYIQRDTNNLRVSVRLLNVSDGRQLWAASFDEPFSDIFSVQDAIAAKVWSELTPNVAAAGAQSLHRHTGNAEAYQFYVNGQYHRLQRLGVDGLRQALADFEQAVARDPGFALAYVGIADVHAILGVFGAVAPREAFAQARIAVDRALELEPDLGAAHASLGHIRTQFELDWPGAHQAYRRALQLDPYYAPAWQWRGILLGLAGRFDEAIESTRQAQALDPAMPGYSALVGMLLMYHRRYDEAIEQLTRTLEMDPELPTARVYLAATYLRVGRHDEALAQLERVRTPTPGSAGYRGQALALAGRRGEALAEVQRLEQESSIRYVSAYDIATVYAALGDTDQALAWLERAFGERSPLIGWLPWEPVFDSLRGDPRYSALVAQLDLSHSARSLP